MKVRHGDGVAIYTSPEPCVAVRKGGREASVGEHIGQPLSPAKIHIPGADAVAKVEGDTDGHVSASARTARRGRRTWARLASLIGTCKLNAVEPYAYMKATLEALAAGHANSEIDLLLPWNFNALQNAVAA